MGDTDPEVTGSSLEMLIVDIFGNIMEKESDLLPGCISISYTVTALVLNM